MTKKQVHYSFMAQSAIKAPRLGKINFKILQMMWKWESNLIIFIIQQTVQVGYYPKKWKKAYKILLEKGRKQDFTLLKLYRVISLFNCIGKILENVIAKQLSQFCKSFCKLPMGQRRVLKERFAINAVELLVQRVEKIWVEKKLVTALFIDIKKVFNHVVRN